MFRSPFAVRNVPEGLAVMFLVALGSGRWCAISQFETAPAGHERASSMETSMIPRSPSARANERRGNAERGGHAAHRIGDRIADRNGADCASPVTLITPHSPWMI